MKSHILFQESNQTTLNPMIYGMIHNKGLLKWCVGELLEGGNCGSWGMTENGGMTSLKNWLHMKGITTRWIIISEGYGYNILSRGGNFLWIRWSGLCFIFNRSNGKFKEKVSIKGNGSGGSNMLKVAQRVFLMHKTS